MTVEINLPLSGWRFALERQPEVPVRLAAGPAAVPERARYQQFRKIRVAGQRNQVRRAGLWRQTRTFIAYGSWEGRVDAAVRRRGRTEESIPVYRMDEGFWAIEVTGEFQSVHVRFADGGEEVITPAPQRRGHWNPRKNADQYTAQLKRR
jgi:hypothetical protein